MNVYEIYCFPQRFGYMFMVYSVVKLVSVFSVVFHLHNLMGILRFPIP
jgi:hypothetical protein